MGRRRRTQFIKYTLKNIHTVYITSSLGRLRVPTPQCFEAIHMRCIFNNQVLNVIERTRMQAKSEWGATAWTLRACRPPPPGGGLRAPMRCAPGDFPGSGGFGGPRACV